MIEAQRDAWLERLVLSGLLCLAVLAWAISGRADPDLWWHLQLGDEILTAGLPIRDLHSFTFQGRELVDHEWLTQVGMVALYRLGGVQLLNFAFALLASSVFWVVYLRSRSRTHPYFALPLSLAAALGCTFIFGARPQLVTLLGIGVVLWTIERVREGKSDGRSLWLLAGVALLWTNLHGGVLAGVALMFLYVVGDSLEQALRGSYAGLLSRRDAKRLLLVAGLSAAATLLNPHGVALWTLPLQEVLSDVNRQYILEWMRPDLTEPRFMLFGALLGLGVVGWARNRSRPFLSEGMLFFGTAALGLLSIRHIPLFVVASTPIVCRRLWPVVCTLRLPALLSSDLPHANSRLLRSLFAAFLLISATAGALSSFRARLIRIPPSIEREYPVRAVDFIQEQGLAQRRGLNEYRWGGYLLWRGVPVFIDGRANTLYEPSFMERYFRLYLLREHWDAFADEFEIDYVLIGAKHRWNDVLTPHPGWQEVYRDENAAVFVARSAG